MSAEIRKKKKKKKKKKKFSAIGADNRTSNICGSQTFLHSATPPQDRDSESELRPALFFSVPPRK